MNDFDDVIIHFGVKGMKWGQRKTSSGVSKKTSREAKKDADEFAKAKMFYGEGAGNRRKLIKAKVEAKSKKDPSYKKAFDSHLENQDFAKRASQARGERRRKDTVNSSMKTARGLKNLAMGTAAPVALSSVVIFTAAKNPRVRAAVVNAGKATYQFAKDSDVVGFVKDTLKNFR